MKKNKPQRILRRCALLSVTALCFLLPLHAQEFSDTQHSYCSSAVDFLSDNGVVNGYPDGTFGINGTLTRAEFATMLFRVIGSPKEATQESFPDVPEDHWAREAILAVSEQGLVNGYADGSFRPDAPVLYEEAVKMVVSLMTDEDLVPSEPWYQAYVEYAEKTNLPEKMKASVGETLTRGDAAVLLYHAYTTLPEGYSSSVWHSGDDFSIARDFTQRHNGEYPYQLTADEANDVRIVYEAQAEPDTEYLISVEVKTEGVENLENPEDPIGVNLSSGNYANSKSLFGDNDWTTLKHRAFSDHDGRLTISMNLGYWYNSCTGTAWFSGLRYDTMESLTPENYHVMPYGDPKHVVSSYRTDNYVEFTIDGTVLKVEGRIRLDDLSLLWIDCGRPGGPVEISAQDGAYFSTELSLSHLKSEADVTVYTMKEGDNVFWSYIWNELKVKPTSNGYEFVISPNVENNVAMQTWLDGVEINVSDRLKKLSDEIVEGAANDYAKLYRLNKWVAENIYYDYDLYSGRSEEGYYSADEVYEHKRTVCEGYATLLNALINAQGITSLKVGTENHAHVEAYLDELGRWVNMDPTWDSGNTYEYGKFKKGAYTDKYFDISIDFLAFSRKTLERRS